MLLKYGAREDSWESLGLQGDQTSHWPCDAKNWLIRKGPDAGKDWRQEEKGMTEDETVGWHYQLNGHEFEQVSDEQGSLVWCSSWGWTRLSDWTELNWCVVEKGKIGFQLNKSHGSKTLLLLAFLLVKKYLLYSLILLRCWNVFRDFLCSFSHLAVNP